MSSNHARLLNVPQGRRDPRHGRARLVRRYCRRARKESSPMKLEEMADLLDGLAATLEKHLGKTAVNDLRALGDCLRKFSGETVAAFCNFTVAAREGRSASPRGAARTNEAKIADL